MLQNGVGWTTSSSSGPQLLTAGILPEIGEAAVAEAATIAEAAVAEAAVAEAAVAEAAAIQEATVPEPAIAEDRSVAERNSAVEEHLSLLPSLFFAELRETARPILHIASREQRIARRCSRFGHCGSSNHNRTQRGQSTPSERAEQGATRKLVHVETPT